MDTDDSSGHPCQGRRKDGQACQARALPARRFCFAHDGALRDKRQAAYAAGGRGKGTAARLNKLMPATLRPVLNKLMLAVDEVHDGTLDPRQASAMASLAGAIGRLYEVAELEQRLERLEGQQSEHAS